MAIFTVPEWIAPPEMSALSSTSLRVEWNSSEGHGVVARGQVVEYQVSLLTEQTDNPHAPPLISQVKHYYFFKFYPCLLPDLKTSVLLHNIGFSFFRSYTGWNHQHSLFMLWKDWSRTTCTTLPSQSAQRLVAWPVCRGQDGRCPQVKTTKALNIHPFISIFIHPFIQIPKVLKTSIWEKALYFWLEPRPHLQRCWASFFPFHTRPQTGFSVQTGGHFLIRTIGPCSLW